MILRQYIYRILHLEPVIVTLVRLYSMTVIITKTNVVLDGTLIS